MTASGLRNSAIQAKTDDAGSLRRERMRLVLIEAATQLFAQKGVDATTIDEIVVRAGVAKGTFYNYFLDRSEIAVAVAARIRHELNAAVAEINIGIDDPAERLVRGARLFMAMVLFEPVYARMLARTFAEAGEVQASVNAHMLGDIEEAIATGRIRVPNVDMAANVMIGIVSVAMRNLLEFGASPEIARGQGYARDVCIVLLQGLGLSAADISDILSKPFSVEGMRLIGHGRFL